MTSRPISVEQALNRVRLPDPLDRHVYLTVRQTRLRTQERIDIALALIDRVWSELAADRPVEEVIRDLGDPKEHARRLRAEALAKRSPLDRCAVASFKVAAVALLLLVVAYGTAATIVWCAQPTISSGPFDRLAALATPVDESEAAWPIYRDDVDLTMGGALSRAENDFHMAFQYEDGTPEERQAAIHQMRRHRADGDRLREAAARPALGIPLETLPSSFQSGFQSASPPPLQHLLLPHLGSLRMAARFLGADAHLAMLDGDGQRAVDNVEAVISIAHQTLGHHTVSEWLTAVAILELPARATRHLLRHHPDSFTDDDLARLQHAFESIDRSVWRYDARADRILLEDLAQRLYTDDGGGSGHFLVRRLESTMGPESSPNPVVAFLTGPVRAFKVPRRRAAIDDVMRLLELLETDQELVATDDRIAYAAEYQRFVGVETSDWGERYTSLLSRSPLLTAAPPRGVGSVLSVQRNRVDAAVVAVALERWRRAHGAWPDDLVALVPEFLTAVPADTFDGAPLRYRLEPDGPRLWSAGRYNSAELRPSETEIVLIGDDAI